MDAISRNVTPVAQWEGSDADNRSQVCLAAFSRGGSSRGSRVVARRLLRVLIVDDDQDAADSLSRLVRFWGHDASCAYDAAAALAAVATASPDVVLLDIALPKLDGCKLAVQLRESAGDCDCFLIAVTGFSGEEHRRDCKNAGIDLFLVKPVEAFVIETLLMLERQRLGLSPAGEWPRH
jgi:CheY-like chemotaxis protein